MLLGLGGTRVVDGGGGAKGPRPDPLGFHPGLGGGGGGGPRVLGRTGLGSARFARAWGVGKGVGGRGGAKGPGPGRLGS